MKQDGERVLTPDGRGRVSLARLVEPVARYYLARTEPDGTVILTPAVVMTARELEEFRDAD